MTGNIGDTAIKHLVVRDGWFYPDMIVQCETCLTLVGSPAIEIRDGVIARAWLPEIGEFESKADIYTIRPDGFVVAMPDWSDHPMPPAECEKAIAHSPRQVGCGRHLLAGVDIDKLLATPIDDMFSEYMPGENL